MKTPFTLSNFARQGKVNNKKRFTKPLSGDILLSNRYLTLENRQFLPHLSEFLMSYKGETVTTAVYPSNTFKTLDELETFAKRLLKDPKVQERLAEIENHIQSKTGGLRHD